MLEEVYKCHSQWLSMAIKISKSKYRAEDLVQDMYLKIGKGTNIDLNKNAKGYIYRIMRNIYLKEKEKESKRILVDITNYEYLL